MSYLTLTDVIDHLYSVVATDTTRSSSSPVAALTVVTQVYDHEPRPGDALKPVAVTLMPTGITPDFFQVTLRVYSSVDNDARDATRNLETTISQIDGLLPSTVGPSNWTIDYIAGIDAIVGQVVLAGGREDYY